MIQSLNIESALLWKFLKWFKRDDLDKLFVLLSDEYTPLKSASYFLACTKIEL